MLHNGRKEGRKRRRNTGEGGRRSGVLLSLEGGSVFDALARHAEASTAIDSIGMGHKIHLEATRAFHISSMLPY